MNHGGGMSRQEYFKNALSDFAFEAASGAAIRHLADLGYTVKQIMEQLTYPTPYERVQKTVWEHLVNTGVLLLQEPGSEGQKRNVTYIKEYGKYGRASLRQVVLPEDDKEMLHWKRYSLKESDIREFSAVLVEMCAKNGEENSYISCDFGMCLKKEPDKLMDVWKRLDDRQKDYILGLPWEEKIVYHRLNQRMRDIVIRLRENGWDCGNCYFGIIP